jgi:hypothetical protein
MTVHPEDIVEGDREKTLCLLWAGTTICMNAPDPGALDVEYSGFKPYQAGCTQAVKDAVSYVKLTRQMQAAAAY